MSRAPTGKSSKRRPPAGSGDRDRRQREARTRARARTQRRRRTWMVAGSILVALPLALALTLSVGGANQSASTTTTRPATTAAPGRVPTTGAGQPTGGVALSTAIPPWPLPTDAAPNIAAAGLQAQGGETLQVHYHAHVDIIDAGAVVTVPADIGFLSHNGEAVGLTSLHTHDTSGIVHVESATDTPFTLGQVFTEWGVRLTTGRVGGLVTGSGQVLRVFVDGSAFSGDPATVVLRPHQEIVLWYGPASATAQVPTSYTFPQGD